MPERLRRLPLVGAQRPAVLDEGDRVGLAVDVAGEVLGGPAELEQRLLEGAALARVDGDGVVADPFADHPLDLLGAQHLLQHRPVGGRQHEPVRRVLLQPQPPVAGHGVGDVHEQGVRHGVAGVPQQRVDDLLGVVPGGAGVPQGERRHAVGVDVLGRPFEFGERGDLLAAGVGQRVVDLQQQGLVGLDDERTVGQGESPVEIRRTVSGSGRAPSVHATRGAVPRNPCRTGPQDPTFRAAVLLRHRADAGRPGGRGRPPGGERRRDGAATTGGDDQ